MTMQVRTSDGRNENRNEGVNERWKRLYLYILEWVEL